eukprot:365446-Chlamydomonas_euryale.AAC.6
MSQSAGVHAHTVSGTVALALTDATTSNLLPVNHNRCKERHNPFFRPRPEHARTHACTHARTHARKHMHTHTHTYTRNFKQNAFEC